MSKFSPSDDSLEDVHPQSPLGVPRGIKILVAVHVLLTPVQAVLMAWLLSQGSIHAMTLTWGLVSILVGQQVLLGFWGAMSNARIVVRLLGLAGSAVYLAFWGTMTPLLYPQQAYDPNSGAVQTYEASFEVSEFLVRSLGLMAVMAVLAGVFLLIRLRKFQLVRFSQPPWPDRRDGLRFSIFHLLVGMSVVALVVSLIQEAWPNESATPSAGREVAMFLLVFVVLIVNAICGAWATLAIGSLRWKLSLAYLAALLMGIALAASQGYYNMMGSATAVLLSVAAGLIPAAFTSVVVVSLLVARRCGYRLVAGGRMYGGLQAEEKLSQPTLPEGCN